MINVLCILTSFIFCLNNQLKEVQHPKSITIKRKLTTKAIKNSMGKLSQLTDKQTLKSEVVRNLYQTVWNVIGQFTLTNPFSKVGKKQNLVRSAFEVL